VILYIKDEMLRFDFKRYMASYFNLEIVDVAPELDADQIVIGEPYPKSNVCPLDLCLPYVKDEYSHLMTGIPTQMEILYFRANCGYKLPDTLLAGVVDITLGLNVSTSISRWIKHIGDPTNKYQYITEVVLNKDVETIPYNKWKESNEHFQESVRETTNGTGS